MNLYSKKTRSSSGSSTAAGTIADFLGERRRAKQEASFENEKQKNEFQKQFLLQSYRGQAEWQREQAKMQHDTEERAKERDFKQQKEDKVKAPSMAEMLMLSTGKIPDEQKSKFNLSDEDEQRFLGNLASKHGWTPKEVDDMSTASEGLLGIGKHKATKTKLIFSPPSDQVDTVGEE